MCQVSLEVNITARIHKQENIKFGGAGNRAIRGANLDKRIESREKKNILLAAQKRTLTKIISTYRTVSAQGVKVIAGIPPIDLQAKEIRNLYNVVNAHTGGLKRQVRKRTITLWRKRWGSEVESSAWTKRLIGNVKGLVRMPTQKEYLLFHPVPYRTCIVRDTELRKRRPTNALDVTRRTILSTFITCAQDGQNKGER
ncbi:hypothetical protein HHI36_009656 [Cryptolaemus montrouzieri]|uniref:Uncharacterized protein n=1 Tax=Cryptolaemus montrouzieri TaxID=559131 RepID=A0ABD2MGX9_9CUCU